MNLSKIVVMTTILGVFGLFSTNFATPVSALSLTLTIPSDALSLEVSPTSTFTKSSPNSISVKTDAFVGYSLSVRAQNNNDLINGSKKLSSITQNLSEAQYQGAGNLNTWGYKPSKLSSQENTMFLPGPTASPSLIEATKTANNNAAISYEFTLAAKADSTAEHGIYKNTFIFSATANTVSYSIKYELNKGTKGPNPNPQTSNTAESTVKLNSTPPTRENYQFLGWCDISTSNESCSGNVYHPGDTFPKNGSLKSSDNNYTLYAMWKGNSVTSMQDFYCEYLSQQEQTMSLRDTRDNKNYTIAKLKDGRCWMLDNLKLGNNSTMLLTPDNTNITENYTLPAITSNTNTFASADQNHDAIYIHSTYGGYYTWHVASAGTNITGLGANQNAEKSICPKGWRLPTGGVDGEFAKLYEKYPSYQAIIKAPIPNLNAFGYISGMDGRGYFGPDIGGATGNYWSSTAVGDGGSIRHMQLSKIDQIVRPSHDQNLNNSKAGYNIRCIAK